MSCITATRMRNGVARRTATALWLCRRSRLRAFILRAKVKLEFADTGLRRIGLSGPNAEVLLKNALGNAPANAYDGITRDDVTVIRQPAPHARFELIHPHPRPL